MASRICLITRTAQSDPVIDNETCVYDATVLSTTHPCSATNYACRENIVTGGNPAAKCADGTDRFQYFSIAHNGLNTASDGSEKLQRSLRLFLR